MNLRLLDWNLRHKIVLHVIVIGLLAGSIMTYLYLSTQTNIVRTLNDQKVVLAGTIIECDISQQMQDPRSKNIGPILKRLADTNVIKSIRLTDSKGKILKSSDPDEIGNYIDDKSIKIMNKFFHEGFMDKPPRVASISAYRSLFAINNREECLACHTSDSKTIGVLDFNLEEAATADLIHQNQLRAVLISLFALAVLIFIILRLFERIINRPLSGLKEQMQKVQGGNLSVQLHPQKNDDIGDLARSFNIMVANLKKAKKEIEELHNREMERAGHLASMGELAAGLAHEIKNPVAGIKGALEVINQRTEASAPEKEIFTEILHQTDRIYNVVQDLLSYARPKEINLSPTDPSECIQRAVKLAQSQTHDKEIQFHFRQSGEKFQILCDENKIQEVILNLLINSIAAIEEKGEVSIDLDQKSGRWVEIAIQDNGKGIKAEHLSQVFNPFFTTRRRGTGLGLSICKKIIEAHKGTIDVQSEVEKGTIFSIRLPLINQNR